MTEESEIQIVTGASLRKQSRHTLTNPETGNSYIARKPSLADMIRTGLLPDRFVSKVAQMAEKGQKTQGKPQEEDEANAILLLEDSAQAQITAALIKPRVVENATKDDEVEYRDIPQSDRRYLYQWCKAELNETPVENAEGADLSAGQVENFLDEGQGSNPAGTGGPV